MEQGYLGGGMPRDVGSVVLRGVGFVIIVSYSGFGGRLSLP